MDHSVTNVERKVLTKAFQSKTNHLGQKEDTLSKLSNFSASVKFPPSLSHPFEASEVSRGFSVSRSFQQMFQNTREFDFSGVSVDLDFELALRLKDLLASSPPSSLITFPGRKVLINELMFSVPHTLQGIPGTILEVERGPILIDFSGYSDRTVGHQDRVTLCELTLIFQTQLMDRVKPVLFRLTSQDSALELRDCHLISNAYKKHAEEEESGLGLFSGCIEAGGSPGISVFMRSCNITGFSEVANIGSQASLFIEKSHISECQCNFLTGTSLRQLVVEESVIEKCHGSAVDIHIFQDARRKGSSSSHSTASVSGKEPMTIINIEGSEIRNIDGVGVFIWSEHSQPQNLSVVLNHNRISNCKGEALSIKHVMLQSLQITSNDISCNQGTGCWLQKGMECTYTTHLCYWITMSVSETAVRIIAVGGLLVVGTNAKDFPDLTIRRCTFHTNGENGVQLIDYTGSVTIESCLIFENFHNGLYLIHTSLQSVRPSRDQVLPQTALVSLVRCQVSRNRRYGLSVSKVTCDIVDTLIVENSKGAIEVDEESKGLIKFSETNSERLREMVKGEIGGDWGSLFPEKKSLCSKTDCSLL